MAAKHYKQTLTWLTLLLLVGTSQQTHDDDNVRPSKDGQGGGGALVDLNIGGIGIKAGGGGGDGQGGAGGGFGGVSFPGINFGGFSLPPITIGGGGSGGKPGSSGGGGAIIDFGGTSIRAGGGGGDSQPGGASGGGGGVSITDFFGNLIRAGGFGGGMKRHVGGDDIDVGFRRQGALVKRQNEVDSTTTARSSGGGLLGGLSGGLGGLLGSSTDPGSFFSGLFGLASSGPGVKTFKQPGQSSIDDSVFFYQEAPKGRLPNGELPTATNARFKIVKAKHVEPSPKT